MNLTTSASLKMRAARGRFWIEKDAEQRGRLAWLGATGALAATYITHEDRAESRSAVSVISRAQRKHSMIPFQSNFFIQLHFGDWVSSFIPGPGAIRLRPPLLAADNTDNLCSCWSTGNFSNRFCTYLGIISSGNNREHGCKGSQLYILELAGTELIILNSKTKRI